MPPKPTSTKPEKTKSAAPKKGDKDPSDAELLRAEAMAIVPDLLWDAFDGAIEVLEQKRLASRVTDFTATCLREAILSTLELFHIGADPGETDLLDSTWTADEEPKPVTNDAWSREILQLMGPEQRPRVRSRPKTALGIPSKGRGISFNASGRPSDASGTVSNANWSAHARLFDAPAPPLAREDVTQPKVDTRKVDAEAARVPPRSDAEADAALVPKARLDRQLSREVRDDAQHALAMHEHFGGKDYVYGSNLKALVSMPVSRPELLPRLLATPGARIPEETFVRDTLAHLAAGGKPDSARRPSDGARRLSAGGLCGKPRATAVVPGQLLGPDLTRIVETQPPLLSLIATPSAGVRVIEGMEEVDGGVLPIEPDAMPMRVYQKLGDGKKVSVVVGQEEAKREKSRAHLELSRSPQPSRPSSSRHQTSGGLQPASLGDALRSRQLSTPSSTGLGETSRTFEWLSSASGRQRAPSPQRDIWPETAEFRALRTRERLPSSRNNLPQNARQPQWAVQQEQALAARSDSRSWMNGNSSEGLRKPRSAVSIHNPRAADILTLAK